MENTLTLLKDRGGKWKFLTKDHGEVRFCQNVVGEGGGNVNFIKRTTEKGQFLSNDCRENTNFTKVHWKFA